MANRDLILKTITKVPALPTAVSQVTQMVGDPDVSVPDVMRVLEYDPGLTTNVLRLANSAYFAGPRSISSLREAGVRLGLNRIFQLVMTSAVSPAVNKAVRGYDMAAGMLLEHLISVAIGAESLGNTLGVPVPAHTYTAGLLHDIGKIVLGTFVAIDFEKIRTLAFEEKLSFERAEEEVLGIDHAEVGAVLLEYWKLPDEVVSVVRYHHKPNELPGDKSVVDLVHVADALSMECGLGAGSDGLNYRPDPAVTDRLHLRTVVAEQVSCQMLLEIQSFRQTLSQTSEGGG